MQGSKPPLERRQVVGMLAMALAVLVIANDFTAFSVALPAMEREFASDLTTVQWVINGYALVFGVSIVTGGRLADMYGRRRAFVLGSAIFAGCSLLAGLATDVWMLLGARALMGVGGALMWPATLGMTYALLPKSRAGLAGGVILGAAGLGNALGPLLGGSLTEVVSWRWIFFLNLPVAATAVLVVLRVIDADRPDATDEGVDVAGVAALTTGLLALLLALDLGTDDGWTKPTILALFALSAAGLLAFALVERRAGAKGLVPADVLGNRAFVAAGLTTLLMSAIFFASVLFLPQYMTKVLGFSALKAGLGFLPMMATFALTSFAAGPLYERIGPKPSVCGGALFLAAGMFLLSSLHAGTTYADLVPGMVVVGVGVGLFYSSITTAGITALEPARASLGGAILYMFQIAGGSIGLGLNTALAVSAPTLPQGIERAFRLDAGLALGGLVLGLLFVGGRIDAAHIRGALHRHRAHAP